jgi:hypothetical protein
MYEILKQRILSDRQIKLKKKPLEVTANEYMMLMKERQGMYKGFVIPIDTCRGCKIIIND